MRTGDLEPGTLVCGKYRIEGVLGQGGFGKVYLARHLGMNQPRALKFMSPDRSRDATFLKLFQREAEAAGGLHHPNIAAVHDLDQAEDGSLFIAMEYVEGVDLRDALADSPFPVERALAIARGAASGLMVAHGKGIIHRDIKPENIRLAYPNTIQETAKVLDFGIAAMKDTAMRLSGTSLMKTPHYAAPEQWRGVASDQLDGRTDLYALGCVLYEMLTGRTCFQSPTADGWMYQHLQAERVAPSRLRPDLKRWAGLDGLVLRTLAIEREQRPRDAAELVRELDAVRVQSGPEVTVHEHGQLNTSTRHRGRGVWAVAVLGIAALLGGGGYVVWQKAQRDTQQVVDHPGKSPKLTENTNPSVTTGGGRGTNPPAKTLQAATLTVSCDMACNWKLNGTPKGRLEAGQIQTGFVTGGAGGNAMVEAEPANERIGAQQRTLAVRAGGRQEAVFFFIPEFEKLKLRIRALENAADTKQHDGDDAGAVAALNEALRSSPDSTVTAHLQQKKDLVMTECRNLGISCN